MSTAESLAAQQQFNILQQAVKERVQSRYIGKHIPKQINYLSAFSSNHLFPKIDQIREMQNPTSFTVGSWKFYYLISSEIIQLFAHQFIMKFYSQSGQLIKLTTSMIDELNKIDESSYNLIFKKFKNKMEIQKQILTQKRIKSQLQKIKKCKKSQNQYPRFKDIPSYSNIIPVRAVFVEDMLIGINEKSQLKLLINCSSYDFNSSEINGTSNIINSYFGLGLDVIEKELSAHPLYHKDDELQSNAINEDHIMQLNQQTLKTIRYKNILTYYKNEIAQTCAICHLVEPPNDTKMTIDWIQCENELCGVWMHKNCTQWKIKSVKNFNIKISKSAFCHLCLNVQENDVNMG